MNIIKQVKAIARETLMHYVIRETLMHYVMSKAAKNLKRACLRDEPEDVVHLAFNFRSVFIVDIKPVQIFDELLNLAKITYKLRPKNILEIGTAKGGTLFVFCRISLPNATIISIDLPGGPFGGGYPIYRTLLYRAFVKPGQRIHLIRADSHDPRTLEKVKEVLKGELLDVLFIDGDHTYEGVKRDFEMYSPLVKRGGIIAFHDIVSGPPENVGGVPKFWNEIKHGYDYLEIVKDWTQNGYGIGVVYA